MHDIFAERCPWYVAGPLIGLLVPAMLWFSNRPLGATQLMALVLGWR